MEFEVLKRNHLKRNIIIAVIVISIISAIILNFTRAKYRSVSSVPIINSEINYKVPDLNMVSLYVANEEGDYVEADTIPSSGYTLNTEQSYCGQSNNGDIVKDDTVSIVYENGSISVNNITKKRTKCYLYFDVEKTPLFLKDSILDNATSQLIRSSFASTITNTTTGTIYYADTSKGRTYYFAGNPTDNWVQFAGFYWRIIRINEDESIRLIYSGNSESGPVETGEATQIGTSAFNSNDNYSYYVGYTYTTNRQRPTIQNGGTPSTIKELLDKWYNDNLKDYDNMIMEESGFCNDRNMADGYTWSTTSSSKFYYAATDRLENNKRPTFECNNNLDLYSIKTGLLTADEAAYAGGLLYTSNIHYYLYSNQKYWTMSPHYNTSTTPSSRARVFVIGSDGNIGSNDVNLTYGVRPVINLRSDATISEGNGTINSPYIVY